MELKYKLISAICIPLLISAFSYADTSFKEQLTLKLESGNGFEFKDLSDIPQLPAFNTVDEFDTHWQKYMKHCFDNSGGGHGGKRCAIREKIWDRELNTYYKLLRKTLPEKQKTDLKTGQLQWLKTRDSSFSLIRSLTDKKYGDKQGSKYSLLWRNMYDLLAAPIIKERALTLKRLYEEAYPIYNPKDYAFLNMNKQLNTAIHHPEPEQRKKASYKLKANFMFDQAQGDISFIDKNIDLLIKYIIDPVIADNIIDLLVTQWVTDLNADSYKYLIDKATDAQRKRSIEQLSLNLNQEHPKLIRKSAQALILLNACSRKETIEKLIAEHNWDTYYVNPKKFNCN